MRSSSGATGNEVGQTTQLRETWDTDSHRLVQGGVTPIGAVSRAATGVKMRSNGQGTFWGSVKRSSSMLGTIYKALLAIKRRGRSFCACAVNRWSRVKGKNPAWSSGQGRFSTVKNLDPGRSSGHGAYGSDPPL